MTMFPTSSIARRRVLTLARWIGLFAIACVLVLVSARVLGQATPGTTTTPPTPTIPTTTATTPAASGQTSLMSLFLGSWDLFTVLLVAGSLAAWTNALASPSS